MFPETTTGQARALLATDEFIATLAQGAVLTAKLVEGGVQHTPVQVDGRVEWQEEVAGEVVFEGGRWGPYSLRLATSTAEDIVNLWRAYKDAHAQDDARRADLRKVPAGTKFKTSKGKYQPKVSDRVYFPRGMFGLWKGTVKRLYKARGSHQTERGETMADVVFTGRNGRIYLRRRVRASSLLKCHIPYVDLRLVG